MTENTNVSLSESDSLVPLAELIDKDPLELSKGDIDTLVTEFRRKRAEWEKEEIAARAAGKRPRASKGAAKPLTEKDKEELSLDNLFGGPPNADNT